MQFNRTAIALLSAGALIGTAAVVALQTSAQQSPAKVAPQIQTQTTQTQSVAGDKATPEDTDNIQDPGGIEKADAPDAGAEVKGSDQETNDQGNDKDTSRDNGKDDQAESTVPTGTSAAK